MIITNPYIDINKKLTNDLKYIENDIIAEHIIEDEKNFKHGKKYIKFSMSLNGIAVMDLTKEQYKKYWSNQYLNYPDKKKIIFEAIEDKFNNGLTPTDEMIDIIKKSKDFISEKTKGIKLLGGKYDK